VLAARSGDRAAYGQLYQRYAPMAHGVLLAVVAPDIADDLLSATKNNPSHPEHSEGSSGSFIKGPRANLQVIQYKDVVGHKPYIRN